MARGYFNFVKKVKNAFKSTTPAIQNLKKTNKVRNLLNTRAAAKSITTNADSAAGIAKNADDAAGIAKNADDAAGIAKNADDTVGIAKNADESADVTKTASEVTSKSSLTKWRKRVFSKKVLIGGAIVVFGVYALTEANRLNGTQINITKIEQQNKETITITYNNSEISIGMFDKVSFKTTNCEPKLDGKGLKVPPGTGKLPYSEEGLDILSVATGQFTISSLIEGKKFKLTKDGTEGIFFYKTSVESQMYNTARNTVVGTAKGAANVGSDIFSDLLNGLGINLPTGILSTIKISCIIIFILCLVSSFVKIGIFFLKGKKLINEARGTPQIKVINQTPNKPQNQPTTQPPNQPQIQPPN